MILFRRFFARSDVFAQEDISNKAQGNFLSRYLTRRISIFFQFFHFLEAEKTS